MEPIKAGGMWCGFEVNNHDLNPKFQMVVEP